MDSFTFFVLLISVKMVITISFISAPPRNYCKGDQTEKVSPGQSTLIDSVIEQMKQSAEGSLSCITLIAERSKAQLTTGIFIFI